MKFSKDVKVKPSGTADCAGTNKAGVVKSRAGYILASTATNSAVGPTSCGHSSWYGTAMQEMLAGKGFSKIRCTFSSFSTIDQTPTMLWDPTFATNGAAADQALASKKAAGGSSDDDSGLGAGAIVGIVLGVLVVIVLAVAAVMKLGPFSHPKVQPT